MRRTDNLLHVPIVLISGSLIILEPSGSVQTCNGIALPFTAAISSSKNKLVGHEPRDRGE